MISITFKKHIKNGSRNQGETFQFNKGQVVGVFGKNGAGKTTLLKMLMGMMPYAKQLERHLVDNRPFCIDTLKDMVYITDGLCLYKEMNADEHMRHYAMFYENFNEERFEKLKSMFELEFKEPVKKYSKGQCAKLEMILGLCKGAKYMILDEPFLGADSISRRDFIKVLAGILDEDSIFIISTHHIEEIEELIDRAIFMDNRKIIKDIMMDEIRDENRRLMDIAREVYTIDNNRVPKMLLEEEV